MQSNESFPIYYGYGYGYEAPLANVAIQAASNNVSNTTNFAFPQHLSSLPDPFFNFGFLDGPPGPWTTNTLPPPTTNALTHLAHNLAQPVLTRHVHRPKRLTTEERLRKLMHDDFVINFNEVQVTCSGCESSIKLDRRDGAKYYLGLWNRHKRRCRGVKDNMVCCIPQSLLEKTVY